MSNNASHLREMMENCRRPARVLAITGGKGGVGKSNIAANLGICMSAARKKTLLIDADLGLGNLDIILNINSKFNISHLLKGKKNIEDIIQVGPEGLEVVCGVSGLEEYANLSEFQRQRLINELSKLQNTNDVIIIDTAAGISKSVIGFCLASDHTLVVTTPEATAMTDAYATIKVLVKNMFTGRISLVVNMADSLAEGKKTYQQIANVSGRFLDTHVYNAGVLLRDGKLNSAIRMRKPVVLAYPKARITSSLVALAAKLANSSAAQANEHGFFRKVVDWIF